MKDQKIKCFMILSVRLVSLYVLSYTKRFMICLSLGSVNVVCLEPNYVKANHQHTSANISPTIVPVDHPLKSSLWKIIGHFPWSLDANPMVQFCTIECLPYDRDSLKTDSLLQYSGLGPWEEAGEFVQAWTARWRQFAGAISISTWGRVHDWLGVRLRGYFTKWIWAIITIASIKIDIVITLP